MTTKTIISGTFSIPATSSDAGVSTRRITVAVLLILVGLVLIFTVGFAQGPGGFLHNAAHDTRHAATFPCH